jgi:hypothetical protein
MVWDYLHEENAMKRLMLGVLAALASVTMVRADVPVPPPQGKKFVAVKHTVKLDKNISGYLFFTRPLGLRNGDFQKIELSSDKAAALSAFGKFGLQLLAVPDAAAKKYATEKELLAALSDKWDGAASARFGHTILLPEKDERKEVAVEHIITGFDEKKNILMKDNSDAPKGSEQEESSLRPHSIQGVISGLAASLAFVTGGLWLVRRRGIGGGRR